MARQTITFVLDTERDQDVFSWLQSRENKSRAIREAIRAHLGQSNVTLADVYEAIQDLKRCGWKPGAGGQVDTTTDEDEPPDVAATLDSLGL